MTINRVENEKLKYVEQLNFNCTLQIDSVQTFNKQGVGFIFCHLISGKIDNSAEAILNKKLKHHKNIRFLGHRHGGQYDIFSRRADQYQVGDSILVNSGKDEILFFRMGENIWKAKVSNSLRERVF